MCHTELQVQSHFSAFYCSIYMYMYTVPCLSCCWRSQSEEVCRGRLTTTACPLSLSVCRLHLCKERENIKKTLSRTLSQSFRILAQLHTVHVHAFTLTLTLTHCTLLDHNSTFLHSTNLTSNTITSCKHTSYKLYSHSATPEGDDVGVPEQSGLLSSGHYGIHLESPENSGKVASIHLRKIFAPELC